jgi:hypothetical protein
MPVAPGQKIKTDTPLVKKAREGVMEFLLVRHKQVTFIPCKRIKMFMSLPLTQFCRAAHNEYKSMLSLAAHAYLQKRFVLLCHGA